MATFLQNLKQFLFGRPQGQPYQSARLNEFWAALNAATNSWRSGNTALAEQQCQAMIHQLQEIANEQTDITSQRFVAGGFFDVGGVYREMERVPDAERCFAIAIEKFESLSSHFTEARYADSMLAGCQNQLGMLYSDCGPLDQAETALDNAIARRKRIMSEVPDDMENRIYLAGAICNRAHVASKLGQRESAISLYDQSLQLIDETIPPCDCGCRDAIFSAISELNGHPHWVLTAHRFRQNAEAGRRYLTDPGTDLDES